MVNKPFDVWLETLKRHVATIEKHDVLERDTMKFIFEHAIAHLVLGWSMVSDQMAQAKAGERLVSSLRRPWPHQETANKEGADRVARAEAAPLWWKAGDRFEKFVEYTAKILGMSTRAPYETIFNRLAEVTETVVEARRIWKGATHARKGGPLFALAVARLVGSDPSNADVRDEDELLPTYWSKHNLSILLGNVEKFMRDRGVTPVRLPSDVDLFGRRFESEPQPPVGEGRRADVQTGRSRKMATGDRQQATEKKVETKKPVSKKQV